MSNRANAVVPTLDAHCDSLILREVRDDPLDLSDNDRAYHVDLRRLRRGGVDAVWIMVGDNDLLQSLRLIDAVHELARTKPRDFALCTTAADVRRARARKQTVLLMSIEGQAMFAERIENVRNWRRMGVTMFSLTHGEGQFGSARKTALQRDTSPGGYMTTEERSTFRRQSRGLTPFGRQSVAEVEKLGAILDLAHCNDKAFWEALELGDGAVCFSHGCCESLCPHARNLTDEMMKALASRGGVMGICPWGPFVDAKNPTLDRLCDHFLHALSVMGPDHVGLGTDFDGVDLRKTCVVPDAAGMPRLWEALEKRGVSGRDIKKIASENFLRLLP